MYPSMHWARGDVFYSALTLGTGSACIPACTVGTGGDLLKCMRVSALGGDTATG